MLYKREKGRDKTIHFWFHGKLHRVNVFVFDIISRHRLNIRNKIKMLNIIYTAKENAKQKLILVDVKDKTNPKRHIFDITEGFLPNTQDTISTFDIVSF